MTRAIVIKQYGDKEIGDAIVGGITKVIAMDAASIAAVRAECERLKAMQDIRAYADTLRLDAACRALDIKYPADNHGPVYWAILRAWGFLWYCIYCIYDYLSAWNREQ